MPQTLYAVQLEVVVKAESLDEAQVLGEQLADHLGNHHLVDDIPMVIGVEDVGDSALPPSPEEA